ncbi:MAG: succinate--CoA ligase subunit alpha [Anaerolineae bacterium]|nr:succinate--CoA ligase subunit alpha [Anaerolineae bacterium]
MAILVDRNTRLVVQGITGREGTFHTGQMLAYGTQVVAGVTPGKGGQSVEGVPVFDTVRQAALETGANASIVFVLARAAADAILEAADAGLALVVCVSEGIPTLDMVRVRRCLEASGTRLVGPNCPGVITPGQAKVGIMPGHIHTPGPVGVVSRSGTLTYEVVYALTQAGIGQSTCVGIGGDPVLGTGFTDVLALFQADPQTEAVVLLGEIGGSDEERAAEFIRTRMRKPVVAFVAGRSAPPGKRMGHAGAIIDGGAGTAEGKIQALREAGAAVAEMLAEIPDLVRQSLARKG